MLRCDLRNTLNHGSNMNTVVNFINVKRTNFLYKRRISAAFSSCMYVEKQHSYKKFVRKMLMKYEYRLASLNVRNKYELLNKSANVI